MKNKKNISFYILLSLIFCISYIVLAIKPLGTEHQFSPEWKIDVTNPSTVKPEEDSKLLPFKLGQTLGYFTPDGKVITFVSFPMKASISSKTKIGTISWSSIITTHDYLISNILLIEPECVVESSIVPP